MRVTAAGNKLETLSGHNQSIRCSFATLSRDTSLSHGYTRLRLLPRHEATVERHYTALVSYLPDFQACHVTSRHVAFQADVEIVAFGVSFHFHFLVFIRMFVIRLQLQVQVIQLVSLVYATFKSDSRVH